MSRLMVRGIVFGLAVLFANLLANAVSGQDCGCAIDSIGGHRHFWPGPYGGPNCGRGYNQAQAENLWAGYCTEDCSLCRGGLHGRCGAGAGLLGGCGTVGGQVNSPFAGLAQLHPNQSGLTDRGSGDFSLSLFPRSKFAQSGRQNQEEAVGGMIGNSVGNSSHSIFNRQGESQSGDGAGNSCGSCGSPDGGLLGQLHDIGKGGRLFKTSATNMGCDASSNPVSYSNSDKATQPNQNATPTSFYRYHSGK